MTQNNPTHSIEERAKDYADVQCGDPAKFTTINERIRHDECIEDFKAGFIAGSSQGSEGDAVEFAEWVSGNGWDYWPNFPGTNFQKKEPAWIKEGQDPLAKLPTTPELYQLFIKSKQP